MAPKGRTIVMTVVIFIAAVSGCAAPQARRIQAVPTVTDVSGASYEAIWKSAVIVAKRYFTIEKLEPEQGIIVTAPRTDRDASGFETKRAMIGILKQQTDPPEYRVRVKVPYLSYQKFENVYTEGEKNGKKVLLVERKPLAQPEERDIYLESLIRSEILREAGGKPRPAS